MILERRGFDIFSNWPNELAAPADNQRSLCQSIAGIECLFAKTARCKCFSEALERFSTHGLGAVKGNTPTTQVERGALFRADFSQTEIVSEIWTTTRSRFVA